MRRFFARSMALFGAARADREMDREMAAHLVLLQDEFERKGLSPDEAKRAARREYGGLEQARELHRDARTFVWLEQRLKDIRYGARNLMRTPGFTAIALLTLALGIGANTAVFSVVNAVLLRSLAYKDPDRLVTLLHNGTNPVSPANYLDWRDQSSSFEAMGAAEYWSPNLTNSDPPEHLAGLKLTQSLLPMLGVGPMLGRVFLPGEDKTGSEHEVILSYRLWERRFQSDPAVLGKQITLNGEGYTVVGVMPREFQFAPFWATKAELWIPQAFGDRIHQRGGNSLRVFARLKQGTTLDQARAEIATITARLNQQYPASNRNVEVTPLRQNVVGKVEGPLLMLMGAVGFVLLIACANVTHMLLARTADRQREIAVRTALGASRGRVISQFLTENFLLASAGACIGLLLAYWGTKALVALSPANLPGISKVGIDGPVVAFSLAVTMGMSVFFGLAPAMHAAIANLAGALKEGGRTGTDGRSRNQVRSFLVASEFALAFVLLIGAGLMIRTFAALQALDTGFHPDHVLSMIVSVAGSPEAEPGRRDPFYRQLLEQVRTLPGIESAGGINHLPLVGDMWSRTLVIEGRPTPRPGEEPNAVYRVAMPGYFETMKLPLLRGRTLSATDDQRAPGVILINERAANTFFAGQDPLGKRMRLADGKDWLTIIGVVKNAMIYDWTSVPYPEVYLSMLQNRDLLDDPHAHFSYITLVARTTGNPADMAAAVKRVVWSFDRNLPVSEVTTMDDAVAKATAQPRFEMMLLTVFAAVALVLAAAGIYGVMNYSVSRRTHEIGIRMSLGATRGEILRMVLTQGVRQALAGSAFGIAGALILSRLMGEMLYGVRPSDPTTFAAVAVVLGMTALLASCVPARRAIRIEPVIALRNE